MCAGVVGVETVDVGHEEEVVCVDHSCSDGGEGVIVAEFDFLDDSQSSHVQVLGGFDVWAYVDREGIVLVHDRDDAHAEELGECVYGIEILRSLHLQVSCVSKLGSLQRTNETVHIRRRYRSSSTKSGPRAAAAA